MFGSSTQQPSTSGGLFGSTAGSNQGSRGGLFGSAAPQQQQQQPAAGTSLFGSSTATQPSGGGLFGNTNTTGQQPSTGLFGTTNTTGQQPSTGLFGSTNTTGQQPSTGLFGSTSSQPSSGGVFGGGTQNQGGGLFGSATQQQPQAATNSLFGSTQQNQQSSGGLLGSTTQQQQPSTGGSLFGSTITGTSGNTGGGLFGSASSNQGGGLFGSTPASTGGGGLFGNASTATSSGGLFGSTQPATTNPIFGGQSTNTAQGSSLFGQTLPQQQAQPQQNLFGSNTAFKSSFNPPQYNADPQNQFIALVQRIEAIKQAWDPSSPQCKFQHYFYNQVDPNQVRMYGRPANATNEALWQKAVRENPNPSRMVPVLAVGFDDLQKRVDAQTRQASVHQEKLQELKKRIATLSERHELSNASRLRRANALQTQLTHRLLRLVQHLHLLIPALRSSSITPEEEALRAALEEIDEEIRRPGGMGRMRGKLNELWALVSAINAAKERDRKGGADGNVEWTVVDEEGLSQISQILANQQTGLAHLTKILQKDLSDLAVICGTASQEDPDSMIA